MIILKSFIILRTSTFIIANNLRLRRTADTNRMQTVVRSRRITKDEKHMTRHHSANHVVKVYSTSRKNNKLFLNVFTISSRNS